MSIHGAAGKQIFLEKMAHYCIIKKECHPDLMQCVSVDQTAFNRAAEDVTLKELKQKHRILDPGRGTTVVQLNQLLSTARNSV